MKKETRSIEQLLLIGKASEELGIPSNCLKIAGNGIVLVRYPMIMLGNPLRELKKKEDEEVRHMIVDLKEDTHHIVSPATPYSDKKYRALNLQSNMISAFLNMLNLKSLFPQAEFLMPEGIEGLKPGNFWSHSASLEMGLTFQVKKYLPPTQSSLENQFGITFQLKSPQSKNTHTITSLLQLR